MKKDYLNPKALFASPYFTHTVAVSGARKLVYVAGQVSYDKNGQVVAPGDMRAQTEQIFESLTHNLKAAGAGWGDVVKINGYMVGINPQRLAEYRETRTRYLIARKLPASTLVGVASLVHPDLLLEVEVVAAVGNPGKKTKQKKKR
jgi:enamine deaminase RidA (YjgF/YER057c/UK114 family)